MTRDADPGRATPEPVLCPNGHPNRPGTRICAVCRALIPPAVVAPPSPPAAAPAAGRPVATGGDTRLLALLLLLLALTAATIVLAFLFFYPIRHGPDYLATAAVVTLPAGESGVVALATATQLPTATAAPPSPTPPAAATADPDAPPTPVATITPLSTIVGVVLTPTLAATTEGTLVSGPNLIQNGDFSQDWVNGWERIADGLNGAQVVEVRQSSGDPPRPLLVMSKTGASALRVVQHVVLTGPAADLVFRGQLRLAGASPAAGNEGRAALLLLYENEAGETLGASVWLDGSATASSLWGSHLPPFGPTTAPRIQAAGWQTVEIALAREFVDRLPAIDPAAVRRVTIVLALAGSDGCPPDACAAELGAAALSLTAGGSAP